MALPPVDIAQIQTNHLLLRSLSAELVYNVLPALGHLVRRPERLRRVQKRDMQLRRAEVRSVRIEGALQQRKRYLRICPRSRLRSLIDAGLAHRARSLLQVQSRILDPFPHVFWMLGQVPLKLNTLSLQAVLEGCDLAQNAFQLVFALLFLVRDHAIVREVSSPRCDTASVDECEVAERFTVLAARPQQNAPKMSRC